MRLIIKKLAPHKVPPEARGPSMNVVDHNVLSLAIEETENHPDIPHGVWLDAKGRPRRDFDAGVDVINAGGVAVASGIWAVGFEFAKYGKLLSPSIRETYAVKNMFRIHRLFCAISMPAFHKPFVDLGRKKALVVMRSALIELKG